MCRSSKRESLELLVPVYRASQWSISKLPQPRPVFCYPEVLSIVSESSVEGIDAKDSRGRGSFAQAPFHYHVTLKLGKVRKLHGY